MPCILLDPVETTQRLHHAGALVTPHSTSVEEHDEGDSAETAAPATPTSILTAALFEQELLLERQQRTRAESALELMSKGVHLLTLQLKQADLEKNHDYDEDDDNETVQTESVSSHEQDSFVAASGGSSSTTTSNRSRTWSNQSAATLNNVQWQELTDELVVCGGHYDGNNNATAAADLLGLQNAAHMILQHAHLQGHEAVVVVRDAQVAQSQAARYKQRAVQAEQENCQMSRHNKALQQTVEKLRAERRVLVKEVRSLRKELSSTKSDGMMQQLERYVVGALSIHEHHLKVKSEELKLERLEAEEQVEESVVVEEEPKPTLKEQSQPKAPCAPPTKMGSFLGGNVALGFGAFGMMTKVQPWEPPTAPKAAPLAEKEPSKQSVPTPYDYEPVKFDLCSAITSCASYDSAESGSRRNYFFSKQSSLGPSLSLLNLDQDGDTQVHTPAAMLNAHHFESSAHEHSLELQSQESSMPRHVSFDATGQDSVASQLPSPMLTPRGSSASSLDLELPGDPYMLRSLAMPFVEECHR